MTKITNFVWNPVDDCVISELDGTGAVQAVYTNEPQQYGSVISQRRGTTTSTYHADALGTTRVLTDSTQTTTDTYLYDAWGNPISSSGTTVNPFRWVGRFGYYQDASTGLVYVRARMYQPNLARWCSVDPVFLGIQSSYGLARNRMIIAVDPSGLWEQFQFHYEQYWVAGPEDTFEALVQIVNERQNINIDPTKNKACIRPLGGVWASALYGVGRIFVDPDPLDWKKKEPTNCAVYDVSNLLPRRHTQLFAASIGTDDNGYIENAGNFFGASHFTNDPNDPINTADIKLFRAMNAAAESGMNPFRTVYYVGHSWDDVNLIGSRRTTNHFDQLDLSDFAKYQRKYIPGLVDHVRLFDWQADLDRAMKGEFAIPCWFAVDADVTMVGCKTSHFAANFAKLLLRNGGALARGSLKPTWYVNTPNLMMGWGNDNATNPAQDPDFKATIPEYLSSANWAVHPGTN